MEYTDREWAREASAKIKEKLAVVAAHSRHKIPYTSENGRFDDWTDRNICWWTNGFWGGILWQLYHATGMELYREEAVELEEKLDANLMDPQGMDHDSGFKWLTTAVADYKLTGNPKSLCRGLLAASNLAGRFNPAGNFIRAWNDGGDGSHAGTVIIDCMMNLPLLYWATEMTRDPRFSNIAQCHARTVMEYFIRPDGSSIHIGEFAPATGEFLRSLGGQGYGQGSSWTRGQAWALYGFTLSYLHTGKICYLDTAERVADYFCSQIPESGLIPVDFCRPGDWEDSSAAAIGACGLLELSKVSQKNGYYDAALRLLKALWEKRCCVTADKDYLLEKCTAAYHDRAHEFSLIYGDYYFIEAIFKLTGEEIFLW